MESQYQPLPQHDEEQQPRRQPPWASRKRFRLLLHILALLVAVHLVFAAVYLLARSLTSVPVDTRWSAPCRTVHDFPGAADLPTHYTLPSGDRIPAVALGVWQAHGSGLESAVKAALKVGYRHIDDAWIYGNEEQVGRAIKESGVPRGEIWLTSKLWNTFHAPEDIEPILDDSLAKLGTTYLDLYLIHWPIAFKKGSNNKLDKDLTDDPYPTWQKLEDLVSKGKIRNIGISNFNTRRVQNLTSNPLKIKPAVNQVELNFWNPQPELLQWSKDHDILLEAYSPLGSNRQVGASLAVPKVKEIAHQLDMTPAQVILSWLVQRGTAVLPKSTHPTRVRENCHIAHLPDASFAALESAARAHPPQRVGNPSKAWGLDFDIFDD